MSMNFATIFARTSDGIGRREVTILAWVLFDVFFLKSGLAKTLGQLIAFRALQDIEGSGLYTIIMIIDPEITPVEQWSVSNGMLGVTIATGSVLDKFI